MKSNNIHLTIDRDPEFIRIAIRSNPEVYFRLPDEIKYSDEILECYLSASTDRLWEIANHATLTLTDKNKVRSLIRENCAEIFRHFVSEEILNDREIMSEAVAVDPRILEYVSDELKDDSDLVRIAIDKNPNVLEHASERLLANKQFVLPYINLFAYNFDCISEAIKTDLDIVCAALHLKPSIYAELPTSLKTDDRIIKALLEAEPTTFDKELKHGDLPGKLLTDSDLLLKLVGKFKDFYSTMHDMFKDDRKFAFAAVRANGLMLEHVTKRWKNDPDLAYEAVKNNPEAIKFVPNSVAYNNKELALLVAERKKLLEEYFSTSLTNSAEFIVEINLKIKNPRIPEHLVDNKDVLISGIKSNTHLLRNIPEDLKDDRELVLASISEDPTSLQYFSSKIKSDKVIVLKAVSSNGYALEYAADTLKDDEDVIETAIKSMCGGLKFASERLRQDSNFVRRMIEIDPIQIKYAPEDVKNDRDLALKCVTKNYRSYIGLTDGLLKDENIVNWVIDKIDLGLSADEALLEWIAKNCSTVSGVLDHLAAKGHRIIQYLPDSARGDKQLILNALNSTINSENCWGDGSNYDKEVRDTIYDLLSDDLKSDKEILIACIKGSEKGLAYNKAPKGMRLDKEVVQALLAVDGNQLLNFKGKWTASQKELQNSELAFFQLENLEALTEEQAQELTSTHRPLYFPYLKTISEGVAKILSNHVSFDIVPATFKNGIISEDFGYGKAFEIRFGPDFTMPDELFALFDQCYCNLSFENKNMQSKYTAQFHRILQKRIIRRFKEVYDQLKNKSLNKIMSRNLSSIENSIESGKDFEIGYSEKINGTSFGFIREMDFLDDDDWMIMGDLNDIDPDYFLLALCMQYEYYDRNLKEDYASEYLSRWSINLKKKTIEIERTTINSEDEEDYYEED